MLDRTYHDNFLANIFNERLINVEQISRDSLDSKIKHNILFLRSNWMNQLLKDSKLMELKQNSIF